MTTQPFPAVSLETIGEPRGDHAYLSLVCQDVATEAFTVSDITQAVRRGAAKLAGVTTKVFRTLTTWDFQRPEMLADRAVMYALKKVNYMDLDTLTVAVPVGMSFQHGDLDAYTRHWEQTILPAMVQMEADVLAPLISRFETLLTYPLEANVKRLDSAIPDRNRDKLTALIEDEARWHQDQGNRAGEVLYTTAFGSNRACYETLGRVNNINKSYWKVAPPKAIQASTERLSRAAAELFDGIENDSDYQPGPNVLKTLAGDLELAAHWVEWYSLMATRLTDLTGALHTTQVKLFRVL